MTSLLHLSPAEQILTWLITHHGCTCVHLLHVIVCVDMAC